MTRPPELAGLWELPGGKVAPGESDAAGLARELHEELGVEVTVGARLGADVALSETMTLRAYRVTQTGGALRPHDHRALRWVTADELDEPAVGARRPGVAGRAGRALCEIAVATKSSHRIRQPLDPRSTRKLIRTFGRA